MKSIITDIFFDLDHTLWDFDKNSELAFQETFITNSIQINLNDFLEVYIPKNLEYWKLYREERISKEKLRYLRLKDTFDVLDFYIEDDQIYKLSEDYIENLPNNNHLINDALEILKYLKPNYQLHIITNGFEEIQNQKLKRSNIDHYFTHVINSEMAGVKKPNPIIFELALKKARATPTKAVMIGDSFEADILGAKKVGMHAIHFDIDRKKSDENNFMINNLLEIKEYL